MPSDPTFATFEDGHHEMLLGDAVQRSAHQGRWVDVASIQSPGADRADPAPAAAGAAS